VVHQPLHVGGEYRTVRVGDSVYANQPFLMILDFSDLVVKIAVPEAELGTVRTGNPVLIQPTAYPDVRLAGVVEQVSEIAQSLPDRPASQRFFRATIGVRESHPLLRPGMSVVAQVVTHQRPDALRIPRRAVRFEGGSATTTVIEDGRRVLRNLELGHAGETHFEVLSGVVEGERVLLQ
jgi:membrane fusion protein (multidrug efflux system)